MKTQIIGVLGLGIFGQTLATELSLLDKMSLPWTTTLQQLISLLIK